MPELPEVEHVVRALRRVVTGRTIMASEIKLPKLISPLPVASFNRQIKGSKITGVSRRGKFILIHCQKPAAGSAGVLPAKRERQKPARKQGRSSPDLDAPANLILAVHLRMTGGFLYLSVDDDVPKHSHAIFYLDNDRRLVFRDQRKFGVMKLVPESAFAETKGIRELAPEPFGEEFSLEYFGETLSRSRRSLKTLLLDQNKVLGLGNIYAVEALFRARISPFAIASTLSRQRAARLHSAIVDVLKFAVDHIRGSVKLEEGFSYGEAFERFWQVYDREGEPCVKCEAKIRRVTHGGRSTYWCPRCQRR